MASELLGDWAQLTGGQKVVFDHVFADFSMDARGLREIRALQAESPSIHFSFGPPATQKAGKPARQKAGKPARQKAGKPARQKADKPATQTAA